MKICCMGLRGYFMRSTYRYEAFLALVTTINTIQSVALLRSVSVLRIIRLVKLSPTLEGFVYKVQYLNRYSIMFSHSRGNSCKNLTLYQ